MGKIMKTLQLTHLEVEEVNQILDALSQQPYIRVFKLINKIQAQATQQLRATEAGSDSIPSNGTQKSEHEPTTVHTDS